MRMEEILKSLLAIALAAVVRTWATAQFDVASCNSKWRLSMTPAAEIKSLCCSHLCVVGRLSTFDLPSSSSSATLHHSDLATCWGIGRSPVVLTDELPSEYVAGHGQRYLVGISVGACMR